MPAPPVFQTTPLDNMAAIGAIEPHAARLWMRSSRTGLHRAEWWAEDAPERVFSRSVRIEEGNASDNTCGFMLSEEEAAAPLRPMTRYRYRITHAEAGTLVGEGAFETAPARAEDAPERFSIAFSSCNQPFDAHGAVLPEGVQMLRAVKKLFEQRNTKLFLMLGDQMYSDSPEALSLFDADHFAQVAPPGRADILECSAAEVRRLYHDRYRHFWHVPEFQAIHADIPTYIILDDHDIVDNWGSDPAHLEPQWQSLGLGARHAYYDYQASRVMPRGASLPEDFHFSFRYGPVAVFVMDIRSNRRAGPDGHLYSEQQHANLLRFLDETADLHTIVIGLSVPVIHLPNLLARLVSKLPATSEDFSDRWSSGPMVRDRDRFIKDLHRHQQSHPGQRIIFVSGDIHIGCVQELRWKDGTPPVYQAISSPLTHTTSRLVQFASKTVIRLNHGAETFDGDVRAAIRLLPGRGGKGSNPYGPLNIGLIEFETHGAEGATRARFQLYGHDAGEPVCVYESDWL